MFRGVFRGRHGTIGLNIARLHPRSVLVWYKKGIAVDAVAYAAGPASTAAREPSIVSFDEDYEHIAIGYLHVGCAKLQRGYLDVVYFALDCLLGG